MVTSNGYLLIYKSIVIATFPVNLWMMHFRVSWIHLLYMCFCNKLWWFILIGEMLFIRQYFLLNPLANESLNFSLLNHPINPTMQFCIMPGFFAPFYEGACPRALKKKQKNPTMRKAQNSPSRFFISVLCLDHLDGPKALCNALE